MAKRNEAVMDEQMTLWPINPAVRGLGASTMKLKGGLLELDMVGATEATSLEQITPAVMAEAYIEAACQLVGGDWYRLRGMLDRRHSAYSDALNASAGPDDVERVLNVQELPECAMEIGEAAAEAALQDAEHAAVAEAVAADNVVPIGGR